MDPKMRQEIWEWVKSLAIAVVIALLLKQYVLFLPKVPTGSMVPTIGLDERILVDKLTYRFAPIQRGEIVVFPQPDNTDELYVKRVIGLGGETVDIHDGQVFINGNPLDEPYLHVVTQGRFGPYQVPEGQLFLMGDNRNNSRDSRYWIKTHYIRMQDVQGRARAIIWPLGHIRWLH